MSPFPSQDEASAAPPPAWAAVWGSAGARCPCHAPRCGQEAPTTRADGRCVGHGPNAPRGRRGSAPAPPALVSLGGMLPLSRQRCPAPGDKFKVRPIFWALFCGEQTHSGLKRGRVGCELSLGDPCPLAHWSRVAGEHACKCVRVRPVYIHIYVSAHVYVRVPLAPCAYVCAWICMCARVHVCGLGCGIWVSLAVYFH